MQTGRLRNVRARAAVRWMLVGAFIAIVPAGIAAVTPPQKCAIAKNKAAVKKIGAELKCHQQAYTRAVAVDLACLAKAAAKFDAAIVKAEAAAGCVTTGDGATIEGAVDVCVGSIVSLTPPDGTIVTTTSTTSTTLAPPCATSADCPPTGSECVVATCSGAPTRCGVTLLGPTHELSEQAAGDCRKLVCDGEGGAVAVPDANDLPAAPTSPCVVAACTSACDDGALAPGFGPAATGTDCSDEGPAPRHVCGDTSSEAAGTCVECNVDADCADAGASCSDHVCITHGTQTFEFAGSEQAFKVPDGVTRITIAAFGAQGGPGLLGALGGSVTATILVTPGETLSVFVGGLSVGITSAGGYNGGGPGGYGSGGNYGGGGGGASDVRQGGNALGDRLVVAGGGGGNSALETAGGVGGGIVGGNGSGAPSFEGLGGTQVHGGAGGGIPDRDGEPGRLGVGGAGAFHDGQPSISSMYGGGGGGGGYYGGGGGGAYGGPSVGVFVAGGGGGSSYAAPNATGVSIMSGTNAGYGRVVITW